MPVHLMLLMLMLRAPADKMPGQVVAGGSREGVQRRGHKVPPVRVQMVRGASDQIFHVAVQI